MGYKDTLLSQILKRVRFDPAQVGLQDPSVQTHFKTLLLEFLKLLPDWILTPLTHKEIHFVFGRSDGIEGITNIVHVIPNAFELTPTPRLLEITGRTPPSLEWTTKPFISDSVKTTMQVLKDDTRFLSRHILIQEIFNAIAPKIDPIDFTSDTFISCKNTGKATLVIRDNDSRNYFAEAVQFRGTQAPTIDIAEAGRNCTFSLSSVINDFDVVHASCSIPGPERIEAIPPHLTFETYFDFVFDSGCKIPHQVHDQIKRAVTQAALPPHPSPVQPKALKVNNELSPTTLFLFNFFIHSIAESFKKLPASYQNRYSLALKVLQLTITILSFYFVGLPAVLMSTLTLIDGYFSDKNESVMMKELKQFLCFAALSMMKKVSEDNYTDFASFSADVMTQWGIMTSAKYTAKATVATSSIMFKGRKRHQTRTNRPISLIKEFNKKRSSNMTLSAADETKAPPAKAEPAATQQNEKNRVITPKIQEPRNKSKRKMAANSSQQHGRLHQAKGSRKIGQERKVNIPADDIYVEAAAAADPQIEQNEIDLIRKAPKIIDNADNISINSNDSRSNADSPALDALMADIIATIKPPADANEIPKNGITFATTHGGLLETTCNIDQTTHLINHPSLQDYPGDKPLIMKINNCDKYPTLTDFIEKLHENVKGMITGGFALQIIEMLLGIRTHEDFNPSTSDIDIITGKTDLERLMTSEGAEAGTYKSKQPIYTDKIFERVDVCFPNTPPIEASSMFSDNINPDFKEQTDADRALEIALQFKTLRHFTIKSTGVKIGVGPDNSITIYLPNKGTLNDIKDKKLDCALVNRKQFQPEWLLMTLAMELEGHKPKNAELHPKIANNVKYINGFAKINFLRKYLMRYGGAYYKKLNDSTIDGKRLITILFENNLGRPWENDLGRPPAGNEAVYYQQLDGIKRHLTGTSEELQLTGLFFVICQPEIKYLIQKNLNKATNNRFDTYKDILKTNIESCVKNHFSRLGINFQRRTSSDIQPQLTKLETVANNIATIFMHHLFNPEQACTNDALLPIFNYLNDKNIHEIKPDDSYLCTAIKKLFRNSPQTSPVQSNFFKHGQAVYHSLPPGYYTPQFQ